MLRKLGRFEKAMLIANQHAPFNIVSVLRLGNAPSPAAIKQVLQSLQQRHPFLRAKITQNGAGPVFEMLPDAQVPLTIIQRTHSDDWKQAAAREMDFGFPHGEGPLFRAAYVTDGEEAEFILNIHHGIVDAVSGMNLLVEFLQLCSGQAEGLPKLPPISRLEDQFPPSKNGFNRIFVAGKYLFSQIQDMSRYMWKIRDTRKPPMRFGGHSHMMVTTLPIDLVETLTLEGRKRRVTLNSILNAAQLLAVNRVLYNAQPTTMRTYAFADMRPFTTPPTDSKHLGNYISMLGYTIKIADQHDFWKLAQTVHQNIYDSLKNGDKFGAILMSEPLLKAMTGFKAMRFGAAALNFNAIVPLEKQYGEIVVKGLHGFVSGFDLGPELASQTRLFDNKLWWDFVYLNTDMDEATAETILGEIMLILQQAT